MKYLNHKVYGLAVVAASTVACLNLGTQSSSGDGGAWGGSETASSSSGGGSSANTFGRRYGDDEEQTAYHFALADDGSTFITGVYNGSMLLAPNVGVTDDNGPPTQAFLAKLDRKGTPQWIINPSMQVGNSSVGNSIAISNGILAWGGTIGEDPEPHDMFVEIGSLTDDNLVASTVLGSQFHDVLTSLALSNDGKTVFVAGVLNGSAQMYTGCPALAPYDTNGYSNLVVMALDTTANLNCKWGKTWTGGSHNPGTIRIAVAADGHPVISGGYSQGTIDGTGLPMGTFAFVMKLDAADGTFLGARSIPNLLPLSLAADPSTDRIAVAGLLTGSLMFAGIAQDGPVMPDSSHIAMMAYDGALNEKWFRPLAGTSGQFCQSISTDGAGRFYAGCLNSGPLIIPNGPTFDCPGDNILCGLLVTLASADGTVFGDKSRVFGIGEPSKPGCTFLTAASPNGLVIGGSWIDPITLYGEMPLSPSGATTDYDIVVSKVEPAP